MKKRISLISIIAILIGCTSYRTSQFQLVEYFSLRSDSLSYIPNAKSCGPYKFIPEVRPQETKSRYGAVDVYYVTVEIYDSTSQNGEETRQTLREVVRLEEVRLYFDQTNTNHSMSVSKTENLDNMNCHGLYYSFGSISIPDTVNSIKMILPIEWKHGNKYSTTCDSLNFTFRRENTYPNPFSPSPAIRFEILREEHVKITLYNFDGKEVCILLDQVMSPGTHEIPNNSCLNESLELPSGVYFYKLEAGEFVEKKKMVLVR